MISVVAQTLVCVCDSLDEVTQPQNKICATSSAFSRAL